MIDYSQYSPRRDPQGSVSRERAFFESLLFCSFLNPPRSPHTQLSAASVVPHDLSLARWVPKYWTLLPSALYLIW